MKKIYTILACAAIMMAAAFFAISCEDEETGSVPATGVTITPPNPTLPVGSTQQLTAAVTPDNASDKTLTWRSNKPAVISVSDDGQLTALAVGSATVTATANNGVQGTCMITVIPVAVTSVTLSETTLNLPVGEAATLTATVAPDNATDKTITWSSNATGIATVNNDGVVTAVAIGAATVTATAGNGVTATCAVTVSTVEVTAITLSETSLSLYPAGTANLTATVAPANATDKTVTWSSNAEGIATVDQTGLVTAVAIGAATVTATAGNGVTATCAVTVSAIPVTGVSLNKTLTTLLQGATETLVATVAPDNATDKTVTWSSNADGIAGVDQTGLVTAVAIGAATITATSNADATKKATCVVTVSPIAVTGVSLNKATITLGVNTTETLVATVAPANATDKTVTWSSNADGIAGVDQTGLVTAVATGAATITVTSNADATKKATCVVTVVSSIVNVTDVSLDVTTADLKPGETKTLVATVAPANATDKTVTWSSSADGIASVDQTGKITAVAVGAATITVTSNADATKKATCVVTVSPIAVTSVSLNKQTSALYVNETDQLTVTVAPANATDKTVTWSSNADGIATVSQTGLVTAVAAGVATITATSNADATKTATCAVTVTVPSTTSVNIKLDGTTGLAVELAYTDNTTENLTITNSAVNISLSGKTIKSIKIDAGNPILIGRKANSNINLKINGTSVVFRDADGNGAIPIGTYAELQLINKDNTTKAGNYKQEADIDLMSEPWTPISTFAGTFDGGRHAIANLYVNRGASGDNGLFGRSNNATIKYVNIVSGSVTGGGFSAGLLGYMTGGLIFACSNNADVNASGNEAAGITSMTYGTNPTIIACRNSGNITNTETYNGGIVGYVYSATTITACYNPGSVTGKSMNGGIVGSGGAITACYNTGTITTNDTGTWNSIGNNGAANYTIDLSSGHNNNATVFSGAAWPSAAANAEWGVGDGSGDGAYWKSLGGWNGGSPVYPKLFFEE
ncbi:MAG: Ig-like domain-containing protein [Prevotellaceae bacterium]|jgi:uncharacterized protein YjdB|nr:Ig-like domain-containing protein [Prevotellaceae bacterium]